MNKADKLIWVNMKTIHYSYSDCYTKVKKMKKLEK